jgi:site-specific DNA recombinase
MSRTAAYLRVSTDEQAQSGVSLDAQRTKIAAYALLYGLDIVATFTDAGASGKTMDRPGLKAALRTLRDGRADSLIVVKLDRLTRSVRDLGSLIDEYFSAGRYGLLSVGEQIDTRSAAGRFMLNVLGSVAQWERETIAERTATALRHKRDRRQVYNHTPLGFDRVGGQLVRNDAEAAIVARIRTMRDQGASLHRIADELNRTGATGKQGGRFHASTVRSILANEIHAAAATAPAA